MDTLLPDMRVLVLEDDKVNRELLTYLLQDLGSSVTAVSSSNAALKLLSSDWFDLAVIDYKLQGDTAEEVITALQAKLVPFVIASGSLPDEQLRSIDRTIIVKPYATPELIEAIRAAIERNDAGALGGAAQSPRAM